MQSEASEGSEEMDTDLTSVSEQPSGIEPYLLRRKQVCEGALAWPPPLPLAPTPSALLLGSLTKPMSYLRVPFWSTQINTQAK